MSNRLRLHRLCRAALAVVLSVVGASAAAASDDAAWDALRAGGIVLLRHATAPGVGDPPGFRLDDCATQRNLDAVGRREAQRIGEAFRSHGVAIGDVVTSRWCRTRETATLAFPGRQRDEPAFDSFFDRSADAERQTAEARALLVRWRGPEALVVVTHQVNITALTGVVPSSAEGIVLRVADGGLRQVGRIGPAQPTR